MKRICGILLMTLLAGAVLFPSLADGSKYVEILQRIDYGQSVTYVIGHTSPDPDAIGSAIAFAELLNANGIQAVPAAAERIDNESSFALHALGLDAPQILADAMDKQFILVDHSSYTHAIDNMARARIVGILDHHGIGDVRSTEVIPVLSMPVGATGSLVCLCFQECGTEITPARPGRC